MTDPASNSPGSDTSPVPARSADAIDLDERLRQAAWENDVATATALIAQGADVNAKDSTIQSAYLIATSEGYADLLDLTLANGADVDDKDSWNGTGLIRAAERGHWLVVGMLLQAGIDRDHVNRIGYQAIHEAVWFGRDDDTYATTIRVLAAGGVLLETPSGAERLTPLEMARQRGHAGLEQVLVRMAETGPPQTLTTHCCGPRPQETPIWSRTRCGRGRMSRLATAADAPRCCLRRRAITWMSRGCSWRSGLTPTRSMVATTRRGSSPE